MEPWTPSRPRPSLTRRIRAGGRKAIPVVVWLGAIAAIVWLRYGPAGTAFPGMVDAARAHVAAQDDGRIASVLIERHQMVTRGQLLARLDDEPLRLRLQQARLQLERLQADRRAQETELAMDLQADTASRTLDAAVEHRRLMGDVESARIDALATRADIEETRVRLQGATADAQRVAALTREGLSAESELIRLRTEQDALGKRISELESLHGEQTSRHDAARTRLQEFSRTQPTTPPPDALLEPLRWRIQEQETEIERIALDGKRLDLLAPFDGVIEAVLLRAGEFVRTGMPVLTVVEPVARQILGYLPATAIARARPSAAVAVLHATTGAELGTATILSVSPAVVPVPERLWRDPRQQEWAFEVVAIATGREAPGERVQLLLRP